MATVSTKQSRGKKAAPKPPSKAALLRQLELVSELLGGIHLVAEGAPTGDPTEDLKARCGYIRDRSKRAKAIVAEMRASLKGGAR